MRFLTLIEFEPVRAYGFRSPKVLGRRIDERWKDSSSSCSFRLVSSADGELP